ncbi:hypothetical protein P6144_15675 [Sphingomonas sp. HITSZ_GF]|uniref:hypothetical protein n=1 Tax=Sphingomonas sp. HITSZ_GF TaxID=3037247 RepID=UPI00240D37EE|nr:hypothetical protein [Sphingomonas sp. HITSZ_GF]MDG2535099.1 hypothetical protein [Sphingomonas sp. HITSZ_GF]
MAMNRAQKRYSVSVMLLMTGYVLILLGVIAYHDNRPLHGPLGYVAGLLPALPIIGVFFAIGRYLVDEQDEYLRVQVTRQALIATGFALSIATAWGFLENFDLVPHVYAYYAAILWFAGLGIGGCVNKLAAMRGGGE